MESEIYHSPKEALNRLRKKVEGDVWLERDCDIVENALDNPPIEED